MSITDGHSEAVHHRQSMAADQQPSERSLLQSVREYFQGLGLPAGQGLSEHATHMHHEDVPNDTGRLHKRLLSL